MKQSFPKKINVFGKKFIYVLVMCAVLTIVSLVTAQDDTHPFAFNGMNSISGMSGLNGINGSNPKSDSMFNNDEQQGDRKGPRVFDAELGHKLSDGIKVTAMGSEYAVKMIPITMSQSTGTREGNRITYVLSPGVKIIYTFKNNGVKEDIVFDNPATAPAQLAFQLELDKMLEARLDKKGNILIYGPNSVLSGFIQTGDDKSAELILKARRNAPKDHLLYVIPAPVVIDGEGRSHRDTAYYTLEKSVLTLHTGSIAELPVPVSIDPSIVVTTTADFRFGNNEGMIAFYEDEIDRDTASGSSIGIWAATTSFPTARSAHATVAYNGYLYITGGWDGTNALDDVLYAPINVNGTIGTWNATTSMTGYPKYAHASVAYNGYLYVINGTWTGTPVQQIRYAPINSDGTIGNWASTSTPVYGRMGLSAVAYNGYMYLIGGYRSVSPHYVNEVWYAPVRANGILGSFSLATSFTTGRAYHTSVVYNGHLYVLGGYDGTNYFNDVQYADINSDGTLGSWLYANSFITAREWHSSVAYNGHLYLMGGYTGSAGLNDVQHAFINTNGSLGPWTTSTSLTGVRWDHDSIVYNGYVYTIGGYNGATLNDVQYAEIDMKGLIYSWTIAPNFVLSIYGHTSVAYNGYLYVLGGYSSSTYRNSVYYAPINTDGTLGSWSATNSFAAGRRQHTSLAYNGYLYVLGGRDASNQYNDVQYAPINTNGTIGAWTATTSFTTGRYGQTSVAYNGYLYVIGGYCNISPYMLNDVQYALINADGTIGAWSATTSFPVARYGHDSIVYGGYLYVVGGYGTLSPYMRNDVQYAPINSDGTVGAWAETSSFTTARVGHKIAAYNGYLYLIGGYSGSDYLDDVQFTPFRANGTVGTWAFTRNIVPPMQYHTLAEYNGYLYIIGGFNGTTNFNQVQYAPLNPAGTISSWSATTSLTTARYNHSAVAYNGYLYILGGYYYSGGSVYLNDVHYAPINANGTIGTWSATTSFNSTRDNHTALAYNGYLYILGGFRDSSPYYYDDVQFAPINSDGTIGTWNYTTSFTTAREGHTSIAYKKNMYVIGGRSSSTTYLDDVQYAPINSDGTVGTWITTTSFTTGRRDHTSAVYNGYLYVIGGHSSSSVFLSDVQYAPVNTDGTVGTWSFTTGIARNKQWHASAVFNGYLYVLGGLIGSDSLGVLVNEVQYAPINSNGALGRWANTRSFTNARVGLASALYNGFLYSIGGYNISALNDVQVATIYGPTARARYSKLLDIGSNQIVDSIRFSSGVTYGTVNLTYAVAPSTSSALFGTRTTIQGAEPNTIYTTGLGICGRYAWVHFDMDDTISATTDNNGLMRHRNVLDFTLNYTTIATITATATATADNQITVSWNAISGAACYNVYRSNGACPGSTFTLIGDCVTGTSYVDNTVSGGTTYSYQVNAEFTSTCVSANSNCAEATATGDCILSPTFAGLVSATSGASSTCQINLAWAAATSQCPGGPNITYHIYKSTDPAFIPSSSNRIAQCVTGTMYADTDVVYNTTYYYVVRAEDSTANGTGPCNSGNEDTNTVKQSAAPGTATASLFSDGFESGIGNWTISSFWALSTVYAHTGTYSALSGAADNIACATMRKSTLVAIPSGAINPLLHFWTRYAIEENYDAGIVQGSTNGSIWTKLTLSPDYPGTTNSDAPSCLGTNPQSAFTGTSTAWTEYASNLSGYNGGNFTVRFNYATDVGTYEAGWFIDDVSMNYQTSCTTISPPGRVLNTLLLSKSGSNVVLNWSVPGGTCATTGYGIYRGSLPWTGYNHASLSCAVSGTTYSNTNPTSSYYYLVTPSNSSNEGSYGKDSAGTQRPQGSSPCGTQNLTACN